MAQRTSSTSLWRELLRISEVGIGAKAANARLELVVRHGLLVVERLHRGARALVEAPQLVRAFACVHAAIWGEDAVDHFDDSILVERRVLIVRLSALRLSPITTSEALGHKRGPALEQEVEVVGRRRFGSSKWGRSR